MKIKKVNKTNNKTIIPAIVIGIAIIITIVKNILVIFLYAPNSYLFYCNL